MIVGLLAMMFCVLGAGGSIAKYDKTKRPFHLIMFSLNLVCIGFLIGVFCMQG